MEDRDGNGRGEGVMVCGLPFAVYCLQFRENL
jgi:hypothetical protein